MPLLADLQNVLRMVLNDNRGNTLTEALSLGIEQSVIHYLNAIKQPDDGKEKEHG